MSIYCIGDLHGCHKEFMALLEKIDFDEKKDELYLTGDLIGRGPMPYEIIKELISLKGAVKSVLGNHDLNFIACYKKLNKPRAKDNISSLLESKNASEVFEYLLSLPLIRVNEDKKFIITHAGIYPQWSIDEAKELGAWAQSIIEDESINQSYLTNMYNQTPLNYQMAKELDEYSKFRFVIDCFTRMRLIHIDDFALEYKGSSTPVDSIDTSKLKPWFELFNRGIKYDKYTLCFGHWASLGGNCNIPYIKALDTGCVWGGRLCALNIKNMECTYVKSVGYAPLK